MPGGSFADPIVISADGATAVTGITDNSTTGWRYVRFDSLSDGEIVFLSFALTSGTALSNLTASVYMKPALASGTGGFIHSTPLNASYQFVKETGLEVGLLISTNTASTTTDITITRTSLGVHAAPANDLPAGAITIDPSAGPDSVSWDNTYARPGANLTVTLPSGQNVADSARSVWYKFTPPSPAPYVEFTWTSDNPRARAKFQLSEGFFVMAFTTSGQSAVYQFNAGQTWYVEIYEDLSISPTSTTWSTGTLSWEIPPYSSSTDAYELDPLEDELVLSTPQSTPFWTVITDPDPDLIYQFWFDDSANTGTMPFGGWIAGSVATGPLVSGNLHSVAVFNWTSPIGVYSGGEARSPDGEDVYCLINPRGTPIVGTLHYGPATPATPAVNDEWASATELDVSAPDSVAWDNTGAYGSQYESPDPEEYLGDGPRSLWYSVTATEDVIVKFTFDTSQALTSYVEGYQGPPPIDPDNAGSYMFGIYEDGGNGALIARAGITYYLDINQDPPKATGLPYADGTLSWTLVDLPVNTTPETAIPLPQRLTIPVDTGTPDTSIPLYYTVTAPMDGIFALTVDQDADPDSWWSARVTNLATGVTYNSGFIGTAGGFGQVPVSAGDELLIELESWNFGNVKWGITPADDPGIEWSDWFSTEPPFDNGLGDPVDQLWGFTTSRQPGAGWSAGRGPGMSWYAAGPFSSSTGAHAYQEYLHASVRDAIDDMGAPVPYVYPGPADPPNAYGTVGGHSSNWGGGTWSLEGPGGGMDSAVHYEIWYSEGLVGVMGPDKFSTWRKANRWYQPPWQMRATNGVNAWMTAHGYGTSTNLFTSTGNARMYVQYGIDGLMVGDLNDHDVAKLKLYVRHQFEWANSIDLEGTVYMDVVWSDADEANPSTITSAISEEWIREKGETMMSRNVPPDNGADATPTAWVVYPNQGLLDANDEAVFNSEKYIGISTWLYDAAPNYTLENSWSNRPGGLADVYWPLHPVSTLFGGIWDFYGRTQADGAMGILYPPQYRWGVLVTPNYDVMGHLKLHMPDLTWRVLFLPEDTGGRLKLKTAEGEWWQEWRVSDGAVTKYPFKIRMAGEWFTCGYMWQVPP